MERFVSRFRVRLLRSLREQVVAALLAVLILAFQLHYGVIQRADAPGAWWSIAWPYAILLGVFLLWHGVGAWQDLRREDAAKVQGMREYATAQSALLWTFEAQARELLLSLEELWHHWHNAGEILLHPLNVNVPKGPDGSGVQLELRDFKVTYGKHLQRLSLDVPRFTSNSLIGGYPSDREYCVVLQELREHASSLDETAQRIYDTGIPL
jgi:hypothetical protein